MSVTVKKTPKQPAPEKTPENVERPNELHPLQTLRSEIDSLFDNMMAGFPSVRLNRPSFDMDHWRETWSEPFRDPFRRFEDTVNALSKLSPRADLKETEKTITITAELPGVSEADIDVSVAEDRLTISAHKKEETRQDGEDFHLTERHFGTMKRSFTLPVNADVDKAKASFKDGVLSIEVPKKALPKPAAKKIPIKG
jgi:HSP20 family protein